MKNYGQNLQETGSSINNVVSLYLYVCQFEDKEGTKHVYFSFSNIHL